MKVAFISDLHAALRLPMAKLAVGGVHSDRLQDVVDVINQVRVRAVLDKYGAVVIAGDLFDQKTPDAPTLVHTSAALRNLADEVPVYLLPGNHDAHDRDGRLYSLQQFASLRAENIRVLGHEYVELGLGFRLHAVPWLPEDRAFKMMRRRAEPLSYGDLDILVCHQAFRGAQWDSGIVSSDGLDSHDVEGLADWTAVISGHYHRRQTFGRCSRYLGSPLDLRFGDEAIVDRGYTVFHVAEERFEDVAIDYHHFSTIELDAQGAVEFETSEAPVDASYVRLIVRDTAKELDSIAGVLDTITKQREGEHRHFRIERKVVRSEVAERLKVDPSASRHEMLTRYAELFGPEGDKAELIRVGNEFLEG